MTSALSDRQSAYAQLAAMALSPFLKAEYYQFAGHRESTD